MGLKGQEEHEATVAQLSVNLVGALRRLYQAKVLPLIERCDLGRGSADYLEALVVVEVHLHVHVAAVDLVMGVLAAAGRGVLDVGKDLITQDLVAAGRQGRDVPLGQPVDQDIQPLVESLVASDIVHAVQNHCCTLRIHNQT